MNPHTHRKTCPISAEGAALPLDAEIVAHPLPDLTRQAPVYRQHATALPYSRLFAPITGWGLLGQKQNFSTVRPLRTSYLRIGQLGHCPKHPTSRIPPQAYANFQLETRNSKPETQPPRHPKTRLKPRPLNCAFRTEKLLSSRTRLVRRRSEQICYKTVTPPHLANSIDASNRGIIMRGWSRASRCRKRGRHAEP
jgi:hypothetical protein